MAATLTLDDTALIEAGVDHTHIPETGDPYNANLSLLMDGKRILSCPGSKTKNIWIPKTT